jgi:hypothetical protein
MTEDSFKTIERVIATDPWCVDALRAVAGLALPDWAIGAGFVRNRMWDHLHAYAQPTRIGDVDVLFFDRGDVRRKREAEIEARLAGVLPDRPWSVRNQARMHVRNRDLPYASTLDAMGSWLETATCVAVRLEGHGTITVLAPFGVDDLMAMKSGPMPAGRRKPDQYAARMAAKNWPAVWPLVRVECVPKGPPACMK